MAGFSDFCLLVSLIPKPSNVEFWTTGSETFRILGDRNFGGSEQPEVCIYSSFFWLSQLYLKDCIRYPQKGSTVETIVIGSPSIEGHRGPLKEPKPRASNHPLIYPHYRLLETI